MLAAEHVIETGRSNGWNAKLRASPVMRELRKVRNIRPGFNKGLWFGLANAGWETVTAGLSPWTLKNHADWSSLEKLGAIEASQRDGDNDTQARKRGWVERTLPPRDRLAEVYFAATEHDETWERMWTIGEVVSAVAAAGFRVELLHEHEGTLFQLLPFLERSDGRYRLPHGLPSIPMMYSLRAVRG